MAFADRSGQPTIESGEPRVSALSSESSPLMLLLLRLFLLLPPANAGMCFFSHLLAPLPFGESRGALPPAQSPLQLLARRQSDTVNTC